MDDLILWYDLVNNGKITNNCMKSFDKLVHNQRLLYDKNFKKEIRDLFED